MRVIGICLLEDGVPSLLVQDEENGFQTVEVSMPQWLALVDTYLCESFKPVEPGGALKSVRAELVENDIGGLAEVSHQDEEDDPYERIEENMGDLSDYSSTPNVIKPKEV